MNFAIDFVYSNICRVIVVEANDADEAYELARAELVLRRLYSASIQGKARVATQDDIDSEFQF